MKYWNNRNTPTEFDELRFYVFENKRDAKSALSQIKENLGVISDGALVAITLMIAESDPKEKDIMTTMVMNLLSVG